MAVQRPAALEHREREHEEREADHDRGQHQRLGQRIRGLSMLTVSHLKAEHVWLGWLPAFRIALLALGGLGSLWLALRLAWRAEAGIVHKASAGLAMLFPVTLMVVIWCLVFFIW